jgi:hypothetical protein
MRDVDRRTQVSRRIFLRGSATAVPAAAAAAAGITVTPDAAWAQAAKNLKPQTMATLTKAARDIYPHDHLADSYYATAVAGYDAADQKLRELMESGVAMLDAESRKRFGVAYVEVIAEGDRVAVLHAVEASPFFKKLRGDLVVTLYNQKPLWAKFGYEGSSADKGGYINRGFNDIDWLPEV